MVSRPRTRTRGAKRTVRSGKDNMKEFRKARGTSAAPVTEVKAETDSTRRIDGIVRMLDGKPDATIASDLLEARSTQ